ncbi:unnamed protein product [Didymodactylos carnosus]|uniref:Uncharacterized protein n=2 Tax=Didymodactylos carnosus TaxID=1234261 RepID=A0A8S2RIM1_9BILA|nr:unnamed protein product [Didymodactylos carnosus]CAF4165696.1 unnamed protein product [Didymodactylos carnosus]
MILVVGANGASVALSTSIDEDAIQVTLLMRQHWSLRPAIIRNSRPFAICKFIDDCCGNEERLKAIPLMISSLRRHHNPTFPDVINTCTDSTVLDKTDQSCPALEQFNSLPLGYAINDPALHRYEKLIMNYGEKILPIEQLLERMKNSCNDYEIHAFLCSSDKKLIESCIGKALQELHDDKGYEDYYEFIIKTKQILSDLNKELIKTSVDDTNTD